MLKKRNFIINYILNNQPESLDIQTDAETLSDEDAKKYIYEIKDFDQPANITDIRVFQHDVDADATVPDAQNAESITANIRHDQN
ncbi:MAG: hypothetical protein ABW044_10350 [Cellvibrio sp.]